MRKPKVNGPPDPFDYYVEWANNRYNPGYYLGGNIPPYLRKSNLGPRASRRMGICLAISASLGLGLVIVTLPSAEPGFALSTMLSLASVALIFNAAVAMFRNARDKKQQRSLSTPSRRGSDLR
jgi:hypothetical protein